MNDGSSPEGAGPEHCCGDLGTRQSPMPCEMPVWVGTVPSGCTPPPGYMPGPGGGSGCLAAGVGWNLNQGHGGRGDNVQSTHSLCSSLLIQQMAEERKQLITRGS